MKLIAGLGNPGQEYEGTRHNIGFLVVDRLGEERGVSVQTERFGALTATIQIEDERVTLLKPQSYMNCSGDAIRRCLAYLKLTPEHLLVVHDDLDYPLGTMRLAYAAGPAGHRGVISIIEELGSKDFCRLRCGIGRGAGEEPVDYVLSRFAVAEQGQVQELLNRAAAASELWVLEGAAAVWQKFHVKERNSNA